MRILIALLASGALLPAVVFDHSLWDEVLQQHVNAAGEVDYEAITRDPKAFNRYIRQLAETSPDSNPELFPNESAEMAYWINAYNAFTVSGVIERLPLESVRRVRRFFGRRDYTAGGVQVSLDDIEHEILRKRYEEPRIHFAIVCASISCPLLWNRAFTGGTLEEQLAERTRAFVNQRRNVRVENGVVILSKILDWFQEDFEKVEDLQGAGAVLRFARRYAEPPLQAQLRALGDKQKVRYPSYDWSLNKPGSRRQSGDPFERELAGRTEDGKRGQVDRRLSIEQ